VPSASAPAHRAGCGGRLAARRGRERDPPLPTAPRGAGLVALRLDVAYDGNGPSVAVVPTPSSLISAGAADQWPALSTAARLLDERAPLDAAGRRLPAHRDPDEDREQADLAQTLTWGGRGRVPVTPLDSRAWRLDAPRRWTTCYAARGFESDTCVDHVRHRQPTVQRRMGTTVAAVAHPGWSAATQRAPAAARRRTGGEHSCGHGSRPCGCGARVRRRADAGSATCRSRGRGAGVSGRQDSCRDWPTHTGGGSGGVGTPGRDMGAREAREAGTACGRGRPPGRPRGATPGGDAGGPPATRRRRGATPGANPDGAEATPGPWGQRPGAWH
jgi:hypothetical protein